MWLFHIGAYWPPPSRTEKRDARLYRGASFAPLNISVPRSQQLINVGALCLAALMSKRDGMAGLLIAKRQHFLSAVRNRPCLIFKAI
ncbi:MAG: hypothetical protein FHK79_04435 [Pseudomonas sp.]|nr:MAG: hypothetical protein FHK79_04435 [Pseudomonas sp.]